MRVGGLDIHAGFTCGNDLPTGLEYGALGRRVASWCRSSSSSRPGDGSQGKEDTEA